MKDVLVVTRTRDRPEFLVRASASICGQRFRDLHWMIVNDGGNPGPIEEIARAATTKGVAVRVLHLSSSRGMEAASNAGIACEQSEFIVIHDDDDTWEPDFLSETVGFLESPEGVRYGGVVTLTMSVFEEVIGNNLKILERVPFNPGLTAARISDMARGNYFSPISFVFRRSAFNMVGQYDETLPVRGDWEFNLRFLQRFDIGVIPRYLANYHRRREGTGAAMNTVTGQKDLHQEYDAIIRNRFLRKDIESGVVGLGFLIASLEAPKKIIPSKKAPSLLHRVVKVIMGSR